MKRKEHVEVSVRHNSPATGVPGVGEHPVPPPELSPGQVARELRCSISQVYKLIDRREFTYRRVGRKYWITAESVAAFRDRTSVVAEPPAPPRPGGYQYKHL